MNLIRWNSFPEMENFFSPLSMRSYGRFPRLFKDDDGDVTFAVGAVRRHQRDR